jgi:LacI family transcriptional regulator
MIITMTPKKITPPARQQPATIHDVAARAGVAISSISRVLSGHPDVSERMRVKVEAAANELGYEPDFNAQSLRNGATKTIGFVVRDISNPFFGVVAQKCEQELRKAGYSMLLMNSDGDTETEAANIKLLRRRKVDGLIASLVAEDAPKLKAALLDLKAPVVLIDREVKGLNVSAIIGNHHQGVHDAVADLIRLGHRRIAFISGSTRVFITRDRIQGFEDAFNEAGIEIPTDLVSLGTFDAEFGESETLRLFNLKNPPTAFLAGGIGTTSGAMRAWQKLGIKPGIDIGFVAIDEWPLFDVFGQQFSSVYRDPAEIGRSSAAIILQSLKGEKAQSVSVETTYIARESSAGGLA